MMKRIWLVVIVFILVLVSNLDVSAERDVVGDDVVSKEINCPDIITITSSPVYPIKGILTVEPVFKPIKSNLAPEITVLPQAVPLGNYSSSTTKFAPSNIKMIEVPQPETKDNQLLREARRYELNKKWDKAIDVYQQIVKNHSDEPERELIKFS
ncbi:MAG: tetratricopeptide repeat protein, partial [Candidatus Desantisbacteria bacterium]